MTLPDHPSHVSLMDIAAWGINATARPNSPSEIIVDLPALQRGYVWKAHQVEALWDSLLREIPVGAFLLAQYDKSQRASSSQPANGDPNLFLLDGQQRATAIGLGFASPWEGDITLPDAKANGADLDMALWVDVVAPAASDDQAFKFRLLTRSHPWGYQRDDRKRRLLAGNRYAALAAYNKALGEYQKSSKHFADKLPEYPRLPVRCAWPWDAELPVPFPLLVRAASDEVDAEAALKRFQELVEANQFWRACGEMPTQKFPCWKKRLLDVLKRQDEGDAHYARLTFLAKRIKKLNNFRIPLLYVPEIDDAGSGADMEPRSGLLELSFVRVNTQGARLEGEELTYSVFKAILPACKEMVEKIGELSHVRPSRLITLVNRLLGAEHDNSQARTNLPPAWDVNRFRKIIHEAGGDGGFRQKLEDFIGRPGEGSPAKNLFEKASSLLVGDNREGANSTGLGRILAADLTQNAPDLYFLLLSAIHKNSLTGAELNDASVKKRILAVLTGAAWFAPDSTEFARRLWEKEVKWWKEPLFSPELMGDGYVVMYPLPNPEDLKTSLKALIRERIIESDKRIIASNLAYGRAWEWDNSLSLWDKSLSLNDKIPVGLCFELPPSANQKDGAQGQRQKTAWQKFWKTMVWDTRLVLFAQRRFLEARFSDYEPEAPDQLEDSDRPYDWDHILPQKYFGRQFCRGIWKYWGYSNGNLRAWPQADNRADGDSPPVCKLRAEEDQRNSFVDLGTEPWREIGEDGDAIYNSLKCPNYTGLSEADADKYGRVGVNTLQSITNRLLALYKHWYETLNLKDAFGA